MATKVSEQVTVEVPVNLAYNQWTQFEEFPQFMGGVLSVAQITDSRLHWVAEIAGVRREWDAKILEQVPDRKVAWAAVEGATNAGAVYFESLGPGETQVRLELEYEPEGLVEKAGDALGVVGRQARTDLDRFKKFIEGRTSPTGAWRGQVNPGSAVGTPGLDDAAGSRGDSGKAGLSGKAVVAGAAAAAVGAAAAHAASSRAESSDDSGTGFRDVVDVLTADHREVTDLLAAASAERDAQRRRDLADIIITELVRHSVAEEMHVYPVMREHLPDGEQAVEHDMEEHKEIESTLKALEGVDADSPEFDETLRRLQAILTDHVQDEETEQFPLLRARVPSEKLVELAAKVETAKKLAPTRPHPAAPNSAAFHKLVGPGVGFVDRLRDKLSSRATPDS